jgi:hypothetical protein
MGVYMAAPAGYIRSMENNTTIAVPAPFTFVSPQTGTEYLVVPKAQWRMAGGIMENCPMYRKDYVQYDIVLNGNLVQFCFNAEDVPSKVHDYENPLTEAQYAVLHSRFD